MPLPHKHIQPTLTAPIACDRVHAHVFGPPTWRTRVDPGEDRRIRPLRLCQRARSTRDEHQPRITALQQQRHCFRGQDLRPRHVRVPACVPSVPHAHLAIADVYVEVGSTVVDQDIEAAVLRGDVVESSVDGAVGAKIELDNGEGAGELGDF